jgi:putative transcriptional regulator
MPITRFQPDPKNLPKLTAAQRARLDAMTQEEIEAKAVGDPDNPPLTPDELERMTSARFVKSARQTTGLSQAEFAERYRINLSRLRDLEQGRTVTDSAMAAYLTVIAKNPKAVDKALAG